MRKLYHQAVFLLFAATVASCAQLGLGAPETFNQKLAVGYATVTQVRGTATQLLEAKKISADDAQNVLTATDAARAGLDISRTMSVSNPTAAENRLASVRTALTALTTYLASRR